MIPYHNRHTTQRRQRTHLGLCLIVLLLPACAVSSVPPAAHSPELPPVSGRHLQGTLVDVHTRQGMTFETLVQAVTQADVVAFGEEHYHPDIQAFALCLFQALAQRRPQRLALAMEFLERDGQTAVDAYLTGTIDRGTFQERLGVSTAFMRYYFPLIQHARQSGLPVLAMNIPRRMARQVVREGLEKTLQHLDSSDRSHLPETLSAVSPLYRAYFLDAVAASHEVAGEQAERFVEAAHLKDETMADSLARFLDKHQSYTVLAIAGRFHFDYGKAIPALLRQRRRQVVMRRITAMAIAADGTIDLARLAREEIADYLWFVPPPPKEHDQDSPQLTARHW